MATEITNVGNEAFTMPFPFRGVLGAGQAAIVDMTPTLLRQILGPLPQTGGIKLKDLPNVSGYVDPVVNFVPNRQTVGVWTDIVTQNMSGYLRFGGYAAAGGWVAPRAGSVRSMSAFFDVIPDGDGLIQIRQNGNAWFNQAFLRFDPLPAVDRLVSTFGWDELPFVAGDVLSILCSTNGAQTNVPNVWVTIEIQD